MIDQIPSRSPRRCGPTLVCVPTWPSRAQPGGGYQCQTQEKGDIVYLVIIKRCNKRIIIPIGTVTRGTITRGNRKAQFVWSHEEEGVAAHPSQPMHSLPLVRCSLRSPRAADVHVLLRGWMDQKGAITLGDRPPSRCLSLLPMQRKTDGANPLLRGPHTHTRSFEGSGRPHRNAINTASIASSPSLATPPPDRSRPRR